MNESECIESQQEARLPRVDLVETVGLLVVPALIVGLGVAFLSGPDNFVPGVTVGGVFGLILARLRGSLYAVRSDGGVKRRLRSPSDETIWIRLAEVEYDEKYDRLLVVVCLLVGIGAFAAIPLTDPSGPWVIRLVAVSLCGFICVLAALGASQL